MPQDYTPEKGAICVNADWLNLESRGTDYQTVVDRLSGAPFDELVEIDLINDRCRNIYHVEGKYFVPVTDGGWLELFHYCREHMVHPEDREVFTRLMNPDTMQHDLNNAPIEGVRSGEFRCRTVDGKWLWTRQVLVGGAKNGLPEGVIYCYIFDIEAQKQRECGEATAAVATFDALRDDTTGLLTDQEFFAQGQRKLAGLEPGQWCVIAVDIENYKLFCDWHGQQQGKFLLSEIGSILKDVETATGGLAGYRGQDDFAMLVPYDIQRINNLFASLRSLIVGRGEYLGFQPIFGICMVQSATEQIMDLYNHAALTAEQAKGDFRNRIRVYNPAMYKRDTEEYRIVSQFQRALDDGEVFFCLQPQCLAATGRIVGAEALARWRTREGRMIPPTRFVPMLEKYGMVTNLDMFIWEGVFKWLRKWLDEGHTAVPISVNVSQLDIFSVDVPGIFHSLLEKYRLPAKHVKVEITESAYAEDTAVVKETVRRLREQGFLVLMDDFGSGYSSLNMLSSLNVDIIKLDAQFLHIKEGESNRGISILESIIHMARSMTIPVIVEGVEIPEQIEFLTNIGCRYMQGYYFYRPMPVEEFEELIEDPANIDLRGFEFKANEQLHTREFLDENVFSDTMLNNILGPVAIYCRNGDNVDIIRYNQHFYRMVGIDAKRLNERCVSMQQYLHPDDREKLLALLDAAEEDRLNGARGVVRVYKPNGTMAWISVQLYYMEHSAQGKRFYSSCEDVTELQYMNAELPGGYYRCSTDGEFTFYYVSHGLLDMVGFTAEEIRTRFGNRLTNLVHHDDVEIMRGRAQSVQRGERPENRPYRLKCKQGGYIYVVTQTRVAEMDGQVCFQSVAIDVTDVVKLRNQMRLLSKFSSDDVVFVRHKETGWKYRVVVHGLEAKLGMSAKAFEKLLNSGELYRMLDPEEAGEMLKTTHSAIEQRQSFEVGFTLNLPDAAPVRLRMKTDFVSDKNTKVEYICTFREE